jgi:hypothetical protein
MHDKETYSCFFTIFYGWLQIYIGTVICHHLNVGFNFCEPQPYGARFGARPRLRYHSVNDPESEVFSSTG